MCAVDVALSAQAFMSAYLDLNIKNNLIHQYTLISRSSILYQEHNSFCIIKLVSSFLTAGEVLCSGARLFTV